VLADLILMAPPEDQGMMIADILRNLDGVTGLHCASRSLASALRVARSLAAELCGRVVVPQTDEHQTESGEPAPSIDERRP
jgi:hypothetical protein